MIQLRKLGLYDVSTPDAIIRQLKSLEDNVGDAVRKLDGAFLPVLTPTRKQTTDCVATIGDMVITDSAVNNITVTAPISTPKNAGRCFAVVRTSSLNAVQVAPATGTVSGAASDSLPIQKRAYMFFSDGAGGWWRTP